MRLWFKKLPVPATNEMVEVDAVQMWEVRWRAPRDKWDREGKEHLECFTSEQTARDFYDSIAAAMALLRNGQDWTRVSLRKSA